MAFERLDNCRDAVPRYRFLNGHVPSHRIGQYLTLPDQLRHAHKVQQSDEIEMKREPLLANAGEQTAQHRDSGCEYARILSGLLHSREQAEVAVQSLVNGHTGAGVQLGRSDVVLEERLIIGL